MAVGKLVLLLYMLAYACAASSLKPSTPGSNFPSETSARFLHYHDVQSKQGYEVTYDGRSFMIDGERTLLLSGAVHYPRVAPDEWSTVFRKMYEDGLNTVQTYIYWNLHQSERGGPYDFSGGKNWTLFVEKAAEAGLFVTLRIGPFVASEWDYGAIPHWINDIPGMVVRSNNDPWEKEMETFFSAIVKMAQPLMAPSGGPIILGQVENEFRWKDPDYVTWCGELVEKTKPGIPFLMCNGYSANNTIQTCNGNDCAKFAEEHTQAHPDQPLAWTENEGWFQTWDQQPLIAHDNRPPQVMAYVVMKWFARGGAHHDYYMWLGGNNFGRVAGSCVTTMYSDGVNLYSDGLPHEPKKTHLHKLNLLLASSSTSLLYSPSQVNNATMVLVYNATIDKFVQTIYQFAYVYDAAGKGVAFVENSVNESALVQFMGSNYSLPGLSSSLVDLPTRDELYNSGKVSSTGLPTQRVYQPIMGKFSWQVWQENVSQLDDAFIASHPLEQLSVTQDRSDYLFYQTTVEATKTGDVDIVIGSRISNWFLVFVDGRLQSNAGFCTHDEGNMKYIMTLSLEGGRQQQLTLLSISLGVNTHTEPGEFDLKGITGGVSVGDKNITESKWLHRPQLAGERMNIYTVNGSKNVTWSSSYEQYNGKPVVWYKTTFASPSVADGYTLLLDLYGMQKGYIFINGFNLGRYWLTKVNDVYVQRYYYIPLSLLQSPSNLLVLIEELGATAPESVQLVKSTVRVPS